MTRILRLLLIAAVALPLWQPAAAQEVKPPVTGLKGAEMLGKPNVEGTVKEKTVISVAPSASAAPKQQAPVLKDFTSQTVTRSGKYTVADYQYIDNPYAPIYGYFYDNYYAGIYTNRRTRSQMIYTEDMLRALNVENGSKIKSLTFYAFETIQFGNTAGTSGQLTIQIGKCTQSSFTSNQMASFNGTSVSGTVTPKKGATEFTVTFSTPFTYTGGNLLVDVTVTTAGTYGETTFMGLNTSAQQSICYYRDGSSNSYQRQYFLPKMTIGFEYDCETPVSGDKAFFQGKTYTWGDGQESDLSQTATDPDQIIAMLRKVYTDPTIPGNLKRGYDENGVLVGSDHVSFDVPYTAAGTLTYNNNTIGFDDTYGWGIPCDYIYGNEYTTPYSDLDYNLKYWYMNPEQYKPNQDGLTLILLELQDDFSPTTIYKKDEQGNVTDEVLIEATQFDTSKTGYDLLKEYFSKTIKSARVITSSRRTGNVSDLTSGTLFKIDCEKMNKFYLVAKGQLQWERAMLNTTIESGFVLLDYYDEPCYLNGYLTYDGETTNFDSYSDPALNRYFMLGHMFEQFSPSMTQSGDEVTGARTDIYQDLINMESFGVTHDCPNVPFVGDGHHFMMYGPDSKSDDCQDVHDMMFFVPDYRMMDWEDRGVAAWSLTDGTEILSQEYLRYNNNKMPTMGMFVIKQYPITGEQIDDQETYRLHLTWTSNLLKFLPGEQGKYTLYRVITNPDGTKTYQKVGNFNPNTFEYYDDVPMQQNGQQVTYIVSGQDVDEFLDLQMSNEESFIIPGLDRAEQIRIELNSDYYFSRYDAADQTNNYSNSLIANNTVGTNVKPQYIKEGSQFKFWRATIDEQTGNVVTPDEPFVVAEVSNWNPATGGTLTYKDWTDQTDFSSKPYGHGYHANVATSTISIANGEVVFDGLKLYDNFSVNVSENAHPAQYVYYVTLETAVPFELAGNGIPSCATMQSGTYAYFECAWGSTMRAWAWNETGNLTGNNWPGTGTMTQVGTHNGKKVWLWTADASVQPTSIKFNWDNASSMEQTGDYPFINGGYYKHESDVVGAVESNQARSNTVSVPVYKTGMTMNPISAAQVEADVTHQFPAATKFDVNARYSSRSEILGYYIYRWADSDTEQPRTIYESDGADASPQGQAGNQGEYYTVAMNADFTGRTENFGANYADVVASFEDNYMVNDAEKGDTYTYAPVVELFAPAQAVVLPSGADRTDYNTYGGPQQMTAGGLVDVQVIKYTPSMYSWTDEYGQEYRYYYVTLKVNPEKEIVPAGYEVAKVRVWRKIDSKYLGEQAGMGYEHRAQLDANGEYMFVNKEDCQKGEELGDEILGTSGNGPVCSGTFGAVSLEQGDEIPMSFVVRVYFTKTQPAGAPMLKAENEQRYYIAEKIVEDKLTYEVPTGINGVATWKNVVGVKYYNAAGVESDVPFQGVNIVVTRYSDGSSSTTKILK